MPPSPQPDKPTQESSEPQHQPDPQPGEEPVPPRRGLKSPRAYIAKKRKNDDGEQQADGEQGDGEDEDEEWPFGRLKPDAPMEARLVQGIVGRIRYHCCRKDETPYAVAKGAGIGLETLYKILRGESYPSFATIARLERYFNRRLWGNEHLPRGPKTPPNAPPCACKP